MDKDIQFNDPIRFHQPKELPRRPIRTVWQALDDLVLPLMHTAHWNSDWRAVRELLFKAFETRDQAVVKEARHALVQALRVQGWLGEGDGDDTI